MRKHGLSENGGSTETGDSLRNLTLKGLQAAPYELRPPSDGDGLHRTWRGLQRRLPPHVRQRDRGRDAAPESAPSPPHRTEVPLPATGTWNAPGKGGAQADIVLTVPQDQMPLLFIEVDNCHESAEELAEDHDLSAVDR